MRMVPNSPNDTGSQAEKLIFDRLRRAFDDRYVAYHSPKTTRHPSKRFPDYVICGPEGLYVLEVKGGKNRLPPKENLFHQAKTALDGLMEDLHAHFPADDLARLVTGYGVVFPDWEWRTHRTEWDPEMLADKRRSRDMEGWLRGLFEYWKGRGRRQAPPDYAVLERLQENLRPQVDAPEASKKVSGCPTPDEIRRRLERLFSKGDGPYDEMPPGYPTEATTLDEWLDVELADSTRTPRQMLEGGDEGDLFLLDRFVNAIATSRAFSHSEVVRDIVRHRIENLFAEGAVPIPLVSVQQRAQGEDSLDFRDRWMDLPNPIFGDVSPRYFFVSQDVDADRLRHISSLLDAIDDGAFF